MLKNIKQLLKKEYHSNLNYISESTVKFLMKRDLAKDAWKKRIEIETAFDRLIINYLQILNYLKYDYREEYIYDDYKNKLGKTLIVDEINDINFIYSQMTKHKIRNKMKIIGLDLILNKWKILNNFIDEYPNLLNYFESVCKVEQYKEIHFGNERNYLTTIDNLKEDFRQYIKQIRNDMNDNREDNNVVS